MRSLPQTPKAVLFDMDGLMFDTEALYRDATLAAAKLSGFDLPISVYLGIVGLPSPSAREVLLTYFDRECDLDAIWAKASALFEEMTQADLQLKPGLIELLALIDERGLPSAIVTSSSRATVDRHIKATGLRSRFDAVIARGDYAVGKPHPDPYLLAAQRLGLEISECVALEDSHNGVLSASSAGAMTIMVPDLVPATPNIAGRCECVLIDLHAVRDLLLRSLSAL